MDDRYARYGAATGIAFVVLLIVGLGIVTPAPPNSDASADEWATYFIDHQDAINTGVVLATLGLGFFVWFAGTLVSAWPRAARACRRSRSVAPFSPPPLSS